MLSKIVFLFVGKTIRNCNTLIFSFIFFFVDYFVLVQSSKVYLQIIFSRYSDKSQPICKIDINIELCRNIFKIPYVGLEDNLYMQNVEEFKIKNCSKTDICKLVNFQLQQIFYGKEIFDVHLKTNRTNEYSIPSRFTQNRFPIPILYAFKSNEVFIRYLQQECEKQSMIYAVENPIDTFPSFWDNLSYHFYGLVKICKFAKNGFIVLCKTLWTLANHKKFHPIRIQCEKNTSNSIKIRKLSG